MQGPVESLSCRQVNRPCLVAAALLLCSAAASAATLEDIRTSYEEKLEHLRSYRIKYTRHWLQFSADGMVTLERWELRELYQSDGFVGKRWRIHEAPTDFSKSWWELRELYQSDGFVGKRWRIHEAPTDFSKSWHVWAVYRDGLYKMATYRDETHQESGEVRSFTEEQGNALGASSPLDLVGLHRTFDDPAMTYHEDVRVLPETEDVDGHPCWVLEHGDWRQWLGQDLGLAVVKKESFGRLQDGQEIKTSLHCQDFEELAPGLFLPRTLTQESLSPNGDRAIHTYTLTNIEFNPEIPESEFDLQFAPGVQVHDETRWLFKDYVVGEPVPLELLILMAAVTLVLLAIPAATLFLIVRSLRSKKA